MTARMDGPFRLSPQATEVDVLAKYFRGFGDPTRLRILDLLRKEERSVGELVAALRQPQPKVSNHLACLRWCGFVAAERQELRHARVGDAVVDCRMVAASVDEPAPAQAGQVVGHLRL